MNVDHDDVLQKKGHDILVSDEKSELEQLESERASVIREFRALAVLALFILLVGAIFYHATEHWSWLDSFYFCTITLTTVGYGDIVPKTDAGKLFDIFYVLIGIGTIALFASTTIKNAMVRGRLRRHKRRVR